MTRDQAESMRLAEMLEQSRHKETLDAAAELRRLHAEVESLRAELAQEQARFRVACGLRLQDEVDAARYRWLRDKAYTPAICLSDEHDGEWIPIRSEAIDAIVDAAMQEGA